MWKPERYDADPAVNAQLNIAAALRAVAEAITFSLRGTLDPEAAPSVSEALVFVGESVIESTVLMDGDPQTFEVSSRGDN